MVLLFEVSFRYFKYSNHTMKLQPPTQMRSSRSTGDLCDLELTKPSLIPKSKSLGTINSESYHENNENQTRKKNNNYLQLAVVEPYETKLQKVLRERNVYLYATEKDMELLRRETPISQHKYRRPKNDLVDLIGLVAPLLILFMLILSEFF